MAEEFDKAITLYEEDAEAILSVLTTTYHFCLSHDLIDQYRRNDQSRHRSALTKGVDNARKLLQGIVDEHNAAKAEDDDVPEELGV